MTTLGAVLLLGATALTALWVLDLVRRGRLYVGYGIVLLALLAVIGLVCTVYPVRSLIGQTLGALFPYEPLAVVGLGALLLLLIYVLHQLSILSDRVARLTQEIAIRQRREAASGSSPEETDNV